MVEGARGSESEGGSRKRGTWGHLPGRWIARPCETPSVSEGLSFPRVCSPHLTPPCPAPCVSPLPSPQRGAGLHAKDKSGQTALHWAAVRGGTAVADVLLQGGADVEEPDAHGYRVRRVGV